MKKVELAQFLYAYVESAEDQEKGSFITHVINTSTQNGKLSFKFWNLKNKKEFPKAGDFIKIKVLDLAEAENELNMYKTLSLDSTSKNKPFYCEHIYINQEDVPEDFLKIIFKDRSKQLSFAAELLSDSSCWMDKNNHKFLTDLLKPNLDKFTTAPAAIAHHHNYKGGLFIHTSEVFSNCLAIANASCNKNFYSENVNTDVLYLSAWLHDLGKIETYFMDGDCPKINSEKENLIGHATISNFIFREAAIRNKLDEDFINKVSHCILSHHEKIEWGAVVVPQTMEAKILCRADYISSRISD
jgi:23S rRNA maturation-related 3'-5' exoribonuclease YhaM